MVWVEVAANPQQLISLLFCNLDVLRMIYERFHYVTHQRSKIIRGHSLCYEQVLFPLLDNVRKNMESAPSERERTGPEANILMHHSRDTARKQWCETQVLIMAGVSRVFSTRKKHLEELGE